MDWTGWTEVKDADGNVIGRTAPADVETAHEKSLRLQIAGFRADAIDPAVDLLMCESFGVAEVCASAKDQLGLAGTAAALGVAFELQMIEDSAIG